MGGIALSAILLFGATFLSNGIGAQGQEEQQTGTASSGEMFAIQNTSRSIPDPTPGHEEFHQAAIALPLREDGKIYRGIVTYTASQPVEVVVLHPFNATLDTNGTSPMPLTVQGQNDTAITLMHESEGDMFDSVSFAGSSLVFHSRNSMNFTVSYTIVGDLVEPTPLPPDTQQ